MLIGIVLFTLPLAVLYYLIVDSVAVGLTMSAIMVVAGFLFCSVSAYMAGLVGSSNNPVSGITIATILFAASVLLLMLGKDSAIGPVAAVLIGAVVCCAACVAGDNLQDLKAGYIVGATPWRQQVMLAVGSISCALVMAPTLNLLNDAYGIGVSTAAHPKPLLAPQATLMASVANGMFGGELPWGMVAIGAGIAIAIIVLDEILRMRGSTFRTPVLAVAVGIYLPLELMVPIFLGGLLNHVVTRSSARGSPKKKRRNEIAWVCCLPPDSSPVRRSWASSWRFPSWLPGAATCWRCPKGCSWRVRPGNGPAWRWWPASLSGCTASAPANRPEPGSRDGLTSVPIPCPRTPPTARS